MPAGDQPSIVIDAWGVADGRQEELIEILVEVFERLSVLEGFLEGRILLGVNPTQVISYARLRSAAERDAAMQDPEVQAASRRAHEVGHPHIGAYTVLRVFEPALAP